MATRFDLFESELMTQFVRRFDGAAKVATESALPTTVQELVRVRASQLNGCGRCIDMRAP